MADLSQNVTLKAQSIYASMLPPGFSRAYQMYVLAQSEDISNINDKANGAGAGAADAQAQNAEQDKKIDANTKAIANFQEDYVSRTATDEQSIASGLSAAFFAVNGVQVVGAQVTGFTPATGTAFKGAFNADQAFTIGAAYSQSEIQALADALKESRQRTKALEDAMRAHGLII